MQVYINNLQEVKRLLCQNCEMRRAGLSCCVSKLDNFRDCEYIVSLNFAIKLLEKLKEENNHHY